MPLRGGFYLASHSLLDHLEPLPLSTTTQRLQQLRVTQEFKVISKIFENIYSFHLNKWGLKGDNTHLSIIIAQRTSW